MGKKRRMDNLISVDIDQSKKKLNDENIFGDDSIYEEYALLAVVQHNLLDLIYEESEGEGYVDLGDMNFCCQDCGALFWYNERAEKSTHSNSPKFSMCCMKGKILLPLIKKPPNLLWNLINGLDVRSSHFVSNIRSYNSMFAFTSIGGKVDNTVNDGGGPPQFIISGQNFHRIGSLLPVDGVNPKFAQLYIYDTNNEVQNRLHHFSVAAKGSSFDESLVADLIGMVDEHNPYSKSFRRVRDCFLQHDCSNLLLRLFRNRPNDARVYNLPTVDEVAALIVGDFDTSDYGRDIILQAKSGELQRIHETHTSFLPLQYPLLFPYGENGFQEDICLRSSIESNTQKRKRVSLREFISFRLHERKNEESMILISRRLFQQFVVDCYSMIESQRLSFIRNNQQSIRKEFLSGLEEAVERGDIEASSIGMRIVLPSSFTGGRRYMFNNCQDAMGICKKFGYPDLFLTFTCNPKWPEIQRYLSKRGLSAYDRPDITCRVFHMKLDAMMEDFKKGQFFGKVIAGMYTVEFQKRGLPHAHILLWLDAKDKLDSAEAIDSVISAELPNPALYPNLFNIVSSYMVHGPCGISNKESPCMINGRCSKFFPKKFVNKTSFDDDGYPIYRRRETGITTKRKDVSLDNRFVVPYNPKLLMKYQAHINIEYCNKSNCIKYLFKYINKGVDRVTATISANSKSGNSEKVDEIKEYFDCRYLSPCESVWRIFAFDIHAKWPSVQRLSFHLPKKQVVVFNDNEQIHNVLERNKDKTTMFLSWMDANRTYPEARQLTYAEFPSSFVYSVDKKEWHPRKKGYSIGRISFVAPGCGDLYYLRLLLTVQRGCTSYNSLKTVNNVTYQTFQEACSALGLLADDKEFIDAIVEASTFASSPYLRKLFVSLLLSGSMSNPLFVWKETWELLSDDIIYEKKKKFDCPDLVIDNNQLQRLCLMEIEKLLRQNGKSLKDIESMPYPNIHGMEEFENILLFNEMNFDVEFMKNSHEEYFSKLNNNQRKVYEEIMRTVNANSDGFFFVNGYGGTGKTFLWKTLTFRLRSERKVVLNVASSGIASLLLPGGRTAHSQFAIPLTLTEDSCCNIKKGSLKAELLEKADLIIWDEAPMVNKWAFEALDRTLRDIMQSKNPSNVHRPFGGKIIVLGGDFRQILPVIPKASRAEIVMSTVNSSYLWKHCQMLVLNQNMRQQAIHDSSDVEETKHFAKWILDLGDGNLGNDNDGEANVEIPSDLLIPPKGDAVSDIVSSIYPNIIDEFHNPKYFEDRAILAPTLEVVEMVNSFVLSLIPGEEKIYLSCDSICRADEDVNIDSTWLTTEFFNDIKCSGLPDHKLILKRGIPVMLMRNIDMASGLCNGTRLIVEDLGESIIGAKVITGSHVGNKVFIPRMNLIPSDHGTPLKFQRRQFPLSICFAMTINKSQGQSLSIVGIFLPRPVFSHGQLYVAVSRVKKKSGLKILICDDSNCRLSTTKNIVYKEVFQKLSFF